jgi:hypothetical protein
MRHYFEPNEPLAFYTKFTDESDIRLFTSAARKMESDLRQDISNATFLREALKAYLANDTVKEVA